MINKLMARHGYSVVEENEYGVTYQRYNEQFHYMSEITLRRKASGKHILQASDKTTSAKLWENLKGFSVMDAVEVSVLPLMWLKAQYMKIRYHWKWRVHND